MKATRETLRAATRSAYDLQKFRIATGLRLCSNFRAKLGGSPGVTDEDGLDSEAKKLIEELRRDFKLISSGIASDRSIPTRRGFRAAGIIESYTEMVFAKQYFDLLENEKLLFTQLSVMLEDFPIFAEYLHKQKGVGTAMASVIISEFDIYKAKYPSSLWLYSGLDVAPDGRGRSRRAEHLIDREYINAKGELDTRKSITYNPFLKTTLMGVLAPSFLRAQSPWATVYYNIKHRYTTDPARGLALENPWTKGHIHNAALRYMIKMFLVDLYANWRKMENLSVSPTYQEAKLGHTHAA